MRAWSYRAMRQNRRVAASAQCAASTKPPSRGTLWNETLAPFRAPRIQNQAAATGFHARTKSVGAGALEVAGLKGALHGTVSTRGKKTFKNNGQSVLLSISTRLAYPAAGGRLRLREKIQAKIPSRK